ncbi:tail protein X [Methylobacterium ajmalii]|uniref:tail protein X n=1 Tax=Methylobacterium ajmalii TaxID=2738439 RepID=UPI002F35BF81
MAKYTTKMFDRLDKLCEDRYGDTQNGIVEYIIECNPGLEKHGLLLPVGVVIEFPNRPKTTIADKTPVVTLVRLWD